MYTVAATDAQTYRRWTPLAARITGSVIAVLASILGSAALIVGATGISGATCAFITSLLLTIASIVTARVYHDSGSALVLGCAGVPLAFTAGLLAVPDDLEAPHLLMQHARRIGRLTMPAPLRRRVSRVSQALSASRWPQP